MNNNKAIQTIDTQAVVGGFTNSELDTLKATIAKGTSNEQFALFVQTCARSGLNPFLNQIYCIVYNGKDGPVMSIQIAVEGIVALAKRHLQYKGFIASEVKENDEFEIDVVSGEPKHHIKTMVRGKTVGAYCVAYREGAPNIAVIITADQVDHMLRGRNAQMWKDYFDDMIVKHAMKRAFRRQFGIEVAEDESIPSGPDVAPYEQPARRDITEEANSAAATSSEKAGSSASPTEPEAVDANYDKAVSDMKAKFKQMGISDKNGREQWFADNKISWKGESPTLAELKGAIKIMDLQIAAKQRADDDLLS